ncbi:MAG: hypothetical protein MI743_10165, partial [Sneathiellales bacterium]|nr:hypothetical protein [Sneathiellales bacterium]
MKYIFIILFIPSILIGEELTLHDCIRIAQSKSLRAKNIELNKKQAEYAHTAFNAQYLPQLSLSGNIPGYTNRIQEESFKGESYLQSYETWRSSLNLQINQIIPFTGGYLGVSSGLSRTDNFGTIENSHWLSNPVVITYNQP